MNKTLKVFVMYLFLYTSACCSVEETFPLFSNLALDLQVKILDFHDNPEDTLILSRTLHSKLSKTRAWAFNRERLEVLIQDSIDESGEVRLGSVLVRDVYNGAAHLLFKRVLYVLTHSNDVCFRKKSTVFAGSLHPKYFL